MSGASSERVTKAGRAWCNLLYALYGMDGCGKTGKGGSSWLPPSLCGPRRDSRAGAGLRVLYANYHCTPQHRFYSRPLESKTPEGLGCDLCLVGHCCPRELNRKRSLFRSRLAEPAVRNPELEPRQDPWRRFVRQLLIVSLVSETSLEYALGPSELVPPLGRRRTRTNEVSV